MEFFLATELYHTFLLRREMMQLGYINDTQKLCTALWMNDCVDKGKHGDCKVKVNIHNMHVSSTDF